MNVKEISTTDLYSLYLFASADYNSTGFGKNLYPKGLVESRLKLIETELFIRAYGYDYHENKNGVEIEGDKPEDIDLSKFGG